MLIGFHQEVGAQTTPVLAQDSLTTPDPTTITARKKAAETSLTSLYTQFSLFVSRTKLAIDRLTAKGVDTKAAGLELGAASASLLEAKTNLDLLAVMPATDTMTEKETLPIKTNLNTIETNLADARAHLIESLTVLKTSIGTTLDQSAQ